MDYCSWQFMVSLVKSCVMTIWWGKCGWYMSNDFFDTKFDQILRVKLMFAMKMWQSWKDQQVAPLAVTCLNPPPSAGSQSWPPGQDGVIPPRLKMQVAIIIWRFRNFPTWPKLRPPPPKPPRVRSAPKKHFSPPEFPFFFELHYAQEIMISIDSLFSHI